MNVDDLDRKCRDHDEAIADLRSELSEALTVLMGPLPTRSNGVRGDLHLLKAAHYSFETEVHETVNELWNIKRPAECLGLEECAKLRKELEVQMKEDTEMRKAGLGARSVILAATIPSALVFTMQLIMFIASETAKKGGH